MKQLKEKEHEEFQQYLYNKVHGYIWTPDMLELICGGNDNEPERIGKQVLEMLGRVRNERISHMTSDKHKKYVIRSLRKGETDLLKDFLYEAIFIPKGAEPPARDIIEKPELRVYTDDFGTQKGDNCLVADFGGKVVGAVWTRISVEPSAWIPSRCSSRYLWSCCNSARTRRHRSQTAARSLPQCVPKSASSTDIWKNTTCSAITTFNPRRISQHGAKVWIHA